MKLRPTIGAFAAAVAVPTLLAYSQEWIPEPAEPYVLVSLGAIVTAYGLWWLSDWMPNVLLRLTRGVTAVASDRSRRHQFSRPWDDARFTIWSWGVGMTSLSRDVEVIRSAVERGIRVTIEIVDVAWLRANPEMMQAVDATYGRTDFVDQIDDSTKKLVALAREINRVSGADRVQVFAVQAFIAQSGTIADADTDRAWGWVEWHTYGFPHGQLRLRMRIYRHRSKLNPPLLAHLMLARRSAPRQRIDDVVLDTASPPGIRRSP